MPKDDDTSVERVFTPGMKRRSVVRVLKQALQDSQRDMVANRVVGIFGVVVMEDGTANLISALTVDELRVVLKAIPEGLHRVTQQIKSGGKPEVGN